MSDTTLTPIGVISHYNLLERIDSSGLGELFRARDTKRGRTVAVRVLPADFTTDSGAVLTKARAVQTLSHPNAIAVFDVGEHEGRIFVVFEFLKGQSLRAEMAGGPINVRRAVDMAIQMADAVAEAHASSFVHGGLSPDSVVITARGHAKIPAFDLAVQRGFEYIDGHVRLSDYDAPEEARGREADDRSDIYSVGAILYEMLTMRRPLHRGASAPSTSNPRVPKELDAVVLRALAPNPDSRYQSIVTFASDLRAVGAALDNAAGEDEPSSGASSSTTVAGIVLTTLVILVFVAAIFLWAMRS